MSSSLACRLNGHAAGSVRPAPPRRRTAVYAAAAAAAASRTPAAPIPELDLKRLYSDAYYAPERVIGPVEVQPAAPGKRRRVVAKRDVPYGSLLFVSEPVAGIIVRGAPGEVLLPPRLLERLEAGPLGDADRYRLSVLYDGTAASQQRAVSFKDLGGAGAAAKAGRAKAAAKGFGGSGGAGSSGASPGPAAATMAAAGETTPERLAAVVSFNAYGCEVADPGAAPARGEPLDAFLGLFPEFALLDHSCAPNAAAALVGGRLVVRAAAAIGKGAPVTVSYLDARGGAPLAERRGALQAAYGFTCGCARCKLEEAAPAELREHLAALHAAARPGGGAFDALPAASEARDAAALAAIVDGQVTPALARLSELLDAAGAPVGSLERFALSAAAAGFLQQAQRAKVAAALAADGGEAGGGGGGGGGGAAASGKSPAALDAAELLDLVEVLRVYQPAGSGLLATAADALSVLAAREGPGSAGAQAALRLFLKMVHARYGEVAHRPTLERLVDALTRSAPRLAALGLEGGFAVAAPSGAAV